MEEVFNVNMDYLNMEYLFKLYTLVGGNKKVVNFYFLYHGQTLEMGLRHIKGDISIHFLQNPEEEQQNELQREPEIESPILKLLLGNESTSEVLEQWATNDPPINEDPFMHAEPSTEASLSTHSEPSTPAGPSTHSEPSTHADPSTHAEPSTYAEPSIHGDPSTHAEPSIHGDPSTHSEPSTNPSTYAEPSMYDSSSSEFDDSSDEDFIEHEVNESYALSEDLDDIEGSDDDDIFVERNNSKQEQIKKLNSMLRKSKRPMPKVHKYRIDPTATGWYSDVDDEDDMEALNDPCTDSRKFPIYNEGQTMKNRNLEVGMKFPNVDLYREALQDWVVRNGYELEHMKNERRRVTSECKASGCNWRIHASIVQGGPLFQIKTIKGEHTCTQAKINKHANASYLGKRMEQGIKDNPDIQIQKLQNTILRKVGVESGYWKAMRAKKAAMDRIKGQEAEEYKLLWDYCETIRSRNPGSKLLLKKVADSNPPVFERMYFSLQSMKMGFLAGCRPLIGLDGCFLKSLHGGQLLCAIGRDPNNNIFPIALAVVPIENREMWTWFLTELLYDIGGVEEKKWTFISDRQKGLLETIKTVAPGCAHRYCVRHIYQNFRQKWSSLELKSLLWNAASTGNVNEFKHHMVQIQKKDKDAFDWLSNIPPYHWTRSHFSQTCKSDVVVNNLCESFNNMILEARENPIISMFEWIRTRMTSRLQVKKAGMEKYEGSMCPNILKKINAYQTTARDCSPRWCGGEEFEVDLNRDKYVVYLDKKTCSCGLFQLMATLVLMHGHALWRGDTKLRIM
ncbi:PREDICTED: uncharacterized protein LOC105964757 [Erythranthe guttata]|uniref:uncharacterized protein LOC105964757 n=1 Tax=Erythranthe guttata TaxID=4155 RepID=UPI00064D8C98|nr:PREDICTED: uncharacterized protein LOC105964757 [Erythranthe guttata]|eukprot:XP_012844716.1 PREDICTED: uncharacterized protein LOC105964757 [Erythranthe guttata]